MSTFENAKDLYGHCLRCGLITPLIDSCCNAAVLFEGETYRLEMTEETYRWKNEPREDGGGI